MKFGHLHFFWVILTILSHINRFANENGNPPNVVNDVYMEDGNILRALYQAKHEFINSTK